MTSPSITERVARLEERNDSQDHAIARIDRNVGKLIWGTITVLLAIVANLVKMLVSK